MSAIERKSARVTDLSPQLPAEPAKPERPARPGLSRPLIELIDMPSDEQIRTLARIFGLYEGGSLYESIKQRLDREAAERKTTGESAA